MNIGCDKVAEYVSLKTLRNGLTRPPYVYPLNRTIFDKENKKNSFGLTSRSSMLCLLLIVSDYKGDLTSPFWMRQKRFFLFSSGHNPAGNDGVNESIYRRVNSQGKAYRHNIKDKSPAMMKSFFIINEHNPEVYC